MDEENAAVNDAGGNAGGDGTDGQQGDEQARNGAADGAGGQGQAGDGRQAGADGRGDEFGDPDAAQAGGGRANDRIRSLVERAERAERMLEQFTRGQQGQTGDQRPWLERFAPDERFGDVHKTLGGYLGAFTQHAMHPVAQALIEARTQQADMVDRIDFYADHPEFVDRKHRQVIERARQALSESTGRPWARTDVVYYLQGHPKYAKNFVTNGQRSEAVDQGLVAARRGAGTTRIQPQRGARGGEEPDLSAMSPADRIKFIESNHGQAAI